MANPTTAAAGRRIAYRRWTRRWSQAELAERTGVPQRTIERWETEGIPGYLSQLYNVCVALDCTLDDLMKEER